MQNLTCIVFLEIWVSFHLFSYDGIYLWIFVVMEDKFLPKEQGKEKKSLKLVEKKSLKPIN